MQYFTTLCELNTLTKYHYETFLRKYLEIAVFSQ